MDLSQLDLDTLPGCCIAIFVPIVIPAVGLIIIILVITHFYWCWRASISKLRRIIMVQTEIICAKWIDQSPNRKRNLFIPKLATL
jgi:hypothetical protein